MSQTDAESKLEAIKLIHAFMVSVVRNNAVLPDDFRDITLDIGDALYGEEWNLDSETY